MVRGRELQTQNELERELWKEYGTKIDSGYATWESERERVRERESQLKGEIDSGLGTRKGETVRERYRESVRERGRRRDR